MNIFVTDESPIKAAFDLDDKRVVKMILESTQMLCTAINETGGKAPYKSTHKNHPSNVWVRQSGANWHWLWDHAMELCDRYQAVYNKVHKCKSILLDLTDQEYDAFIPKSSQLTPFANCAANTSKGVSYKHLTNVTEAYRRYLVDRWNTDVKTPTWRGRDIPSWVEVDKERRFVYSG